MSLLDIRVTESGTVCVCRCEDCGKEFEQAPARKMAAVCAKRSAPKPATRPTPRWSPEEQALARSTASARAVAIATGRSINAVRIWRRNHYCGTGRTWRRWTAREDQMLRSDLTSVELATELERSPVVVARRRRQKRKRAA